jgi:hypothetical protein
MGGDLATLANIVTVVINHPIYSHRNRTVV